MLAFFLFKLCRSRSLYGWTEVVRIVIPAERGALWMQSFVPSFGRDGRDRDLLVCTSLSSYLGHFNTTMFCASE